MVFRIHNAGSPVGNLLRLREGVKTPLDCLFSREIPDLKGLGNFQYTASGWISSIVSQKYLEQMNRSLREVPQFAVQIQ